MKVASRFLRKKKHCKTTSNLKRKPMEILQMIKDELEKSGMEPYFIGKNAEELLARVYFPSVN
jgi:hypothetical protein